MNSKEAMKEACKHAGIKTVAESLGLSSTAIYNQINDDKKTDILYKFVDFANACGNDIPIKWACEELNGVFVKNPDIPMIQQNKSKKTCVPSALKEFGDVIREIGEALQDGVITLDEADNIRKEWEELKVLLETFVLSCEHGRFAGTKKKITNDFV